MTTKQATKPPETIEQASAPKPAQPPAVSAAPPPARMSDGFNSVDDGGGNNVIRGGKLKYTNTNTWIEAASEVVIDPAREFIIVELARVTQKWIDDRPVETRIIGPDEHFPNVETMNDAAPQEEWREAFGKPQGPWQNCNLVYLMDPRTLEGFTWPTSTIGGGLAVRKLKDHVRRARMLQGNKGGTLHPVVTLSDVFMNNAFGGRQRPAFKVVRFVSLGNDTEQQALLAPAKPTDPNDMGGDNIPW
jgi:hypothetical protein